MRILVTGGAGFLGSHLCDALLADGHSVLCLDNLSSGRDSNIAHLSGEPRFEFEEGDVTVPFDPKRVDYVFHFASPASPQDYMAHGIDTLKAGSLGTFNALEVALKYKAGFLLASTSEGYGDPEQHPQKETYWGNVNPVGPRSVYDEAKRFAEAATMAYHVYYGVNTRIVRIFNTYGPRLRLQDGRVISNFMRQALRGEDLTVHGDGKQTRSFCYISDEIQGILRLSRIDEAQPVNVGNPHEFTIMECAETVLLVTGSNSRIRYVNRPKDDPERRCPDISRAKALLDWEPTVNLAEGLKRSLPYFMEALDQEKKEPELSKSTMT